MSLFRSPDMPPNLLRSVGAVPRHEREIKNRHRGGVVWLTGLPGSGKSTVARSIEHALFARGCTTVLLDGDRLRQGLCRDLAFGLADRRENVRRAAEVARLFLDIGAIAVVALISPLRADRQRARLVVGEDDFLEVYCDCPIDICETRDVAGLYRRARQGLIPEFTGVSSPYEAPETPELILQTARDSVADCVQAVLAVLERRRVISGREA